MAISGAYRRWPYPALKGPPPQPVAEAPPLVESMEAPPIRRRRPVFTPLTLAEDRVVKTYFFEGMEVLLPRRQWRPPPLPDQTVEPIPKIEPPFVHNRWEHPRRKPWHPLGGEVLVDLLRAVDLDLQWWTPLSEPVRRIEKAEPVFPLEPPPPDEPPPFVHEPWQYPRRKPWHVPPLNPFPLEGGFSAELFLHPRWQLRRNPHWIRVKFQEFDLTDPDFEHGIDNLSPPPMWLPPHPRPPYPFVYKPMTVDEELFEAIIHPCPRPRRRVDRKC